MEHTAYHIYIYIYIYTMYANGALIIDSPLALASLISGLEKNMLIVTSVIVLTSVGLGIFESR